MILGLPFFGIGLIILILGPELVERPADILGIAIFVAGFGGIGGYLVFEPIIKAVITVRHVRYALSTHAAFIVRDWPVQRIEVYPILPATVPELKQGWRTDTVWSYTLKKEDADGDITRTRIGFQYVANGADVLSLIQGIRTGDTR